MHCEKNLVENNVKTLFGEKEAPKVRLDMENWNIRLHLWLRRVRGQENCAFLPDADYVLSKQSRLDFLTTLKSIRMPTDYCSVLHSKINKCKLFGLKFHDYHVLLQEIMPYV